MTSLDTLLTTAEIAIALAGFSAIVMVMRRDKAGQWAARDVDRFHGMVVHAVFAVAFCFLPRVIDVVVQDMVTSLHIACGLLGVQIIAHCVGVMLMPTTDRMGYVSLLFGIVVGLLQFTAFTDWGVQREMEIYLLGIIWHILQAGMLFVLLIWVPKPDKRD